MQNKHQRFGLRDSDLDEILSVLSKHPKVEKASIVGSRAKGNFKPGSDVDIALMGEELDFNTVSNISYWLNEETDMPYKFDVLNFATISEPALKDHIRRVGVIFYQKVRNN